MNQLDLKGRHAVITGGAAGLGFAITQRLLTSGASVTWWDRDAAAMAAAQQQLGQQGGPLQQLVADVGEHASVVQAVRETVARHAAMVAWLCTEDCSFSTGAVFDLSGGRATY